MKCTQFDNCSIELIRSSSTSTDLIPRVRYAQRVRVDKGRHGRAPLYPLPQIVACDSMNVEETKPIGRKHPSPSMSDLHLYERFYRTLGRGKKRTIKKHSHDVWASPELDAFDKNKRNLFDRRSTVHCSAFALVSACLLSCVRIVHFCRLYKSIPQ